MKHNQHRRGSRDRSADRYASDDIDSACETDNPDRAQVAVLGALEQPAGRRTEMDETRLAEIEAADGAMVGVTALERRLVAEVRRLRARVAELESACTGCPSETDRHTWRSRARVAEARVAELEAQVAGLDVTPSAERIRAEERGR